MKILLLIVAAGMACATQIPSSFSHEADLFLNGLILLGAGMCVYTAGSISK